MDNHEMRYRDLHPGGAHRFTHGVVVGEAVKEGLESTHRYERLTPESDRRAKTWPRQTERDADENIGKEMIVDRHAVKTRPHVGLGLAAVEARDEADAGLVQCCDQSCKVVRFNRNIAVCKNHDIVPNAALHSDEIGHIRTG